MNLEPWSEPTHSSTILYATSDLFGDLTEWLTTIVSEVRPDFLVGIARGAVRLLQLHKVSDSLAVPILSDYALPFLDDSHLKGKTILLFDDSVIFGSTLAHVRSYLVDRGAIVFCAAYTIDRYNFFGEPEPDTGKSVELSVHSQIPVRAKRLLWPAQIRRHHNRVIDAILDSKRDYNLDFPKICLKTSAYSESDLPFLLSCISKTPTFRNIHSVSTPLSASSGIFRYTAITETKISGAVLKDDLLIRPYTKIRITFIPDIREIHLTPIAQLALRETAVKSNIRFRDAQLEAFWSQLNLPQKTDHDFYGKALFRLVTFYEGLLLGHLLSNDLREAVDSELAISSGKLADEDIEPVLGSYNAQILRNVWTSLSSWTARESAFSHLPIDDHEYRNEDLLTAISQKWTSAPNLKPRSGELVYEILGKIFLTLRAVTDNAKARAQNPDISRLEVGLTYEGIRVLLKEQCNISLSPDEISLAIDLCVDNGQAVPKIIRQDRMLIRAFYSGENQDAHSTLQFKDAFHRAYCEFVSQKKVSLLSEFDMHKVAVSLKDLLPWLPFSTKPYTFGRIATITQGFDEQKLIEWLVNHGSGPLKFVTNEKGRRVLATNDAYETCVAPSWSPTKSRAFFDGFQYIATAFALLKDSAPKLLLSTCRTHRHTHNAVAVEAYNWTSNDRGDFRRLLTSSRITDGWNLRESQTALNSIYFCTRFLSEAREKYDIFHGKFKQNFRQLEKAFNKQGGSAARFWRYTILEEKNLLDPSRNREIALRFDSLMPILTQMRHLTAFYVGTLRHLGLIKEEELARTFQENGAIPKSASFRWLMENDSRRHALLYNENIVKNKVASLSIEKTKLPIDSPADSERSPWFHELHKTVETCFEELALSLPHACPKYQTPESGTDFPFSPDNDRLVQEDGTLERMLRDVFILTIEIVKSTDNIQTNKMKDIVLRTFENFTGTNELYFDKSGNDAFLACSRDPMVLIDIAKKLMREGEALKEFGGTFGGTRKGLFLGTVRHVTDSNGHERITDAFTPHVLPQAFSILDGLDARYGANADQLNLAMIVDELAATDVFARLNIKFQKDNSVKVTGKHYIGHGYYIDLIEMKIQ
jgi:hypothetical protein